MPCAERGRGLSLNFDNAKVILPAIQLGSIVRRSKNILVPLRGTEDFDLATSPDQRFALNAFALSRSLRLEFPSSFEFRVSDLRRSRGVSSE